MLPEDLTPEDVKALKKLSKLYKDAEKMIAKGYSFGSGRRPWVVERLHAPFVSWKVKRLVNEIVKTNNPISRRMEGMDGSTKRKFVEEMAKYLEYTKFDMKDLKAIKYDIDSFLNPDPADMPERDPVDILKSIKKFIKGTKERRKTKRTEKARGKSAQPSKERLAIGQGEGFGRPVNADAQIEKGKMSKGQGHNGSARSLATGRSISI
ncbi:hypothetical protein V1387_18070 [Allomuricauda taeanensis]|uniref:hypothetical protein n=1 Tax=Flagellimonas taeanensis TaxID=1005926 RepID=UPI002E7B6B9B|nr:hypothetical protein [Allomuricauda taeanensis]MEE1964600.1 hypothetical protein [Allomuricauda taeanensis]